jgi:transcriptional regulator with PAS, ATPase and Fis domain
MPFLQLLESSVKQAELRDLPTAYDLWGSYIGAVLDAHGGNRTLAAKTLGIDRRTLYRWIRESPGTRAAAE